MKFFQAYGALMIAARHRRGIARVFLWLVAWPVMLAGLALKHPIVSGVIVGPAALVAAGYTAGAIALAVTTIVLTPIVRLLVPQLGRARGEKE